MKIDTIGATGVNEYFYVDICFTAPDDGEWNLYPAKSLFGNMELYPSEGAQTLRDDDKMCHRLIYDITDLSFDWNQPVTIEIDRIFSIQDGGVKEINGEWIFYWDGIAQSLILDRSKIIKKDSNIL